MFEGKSPFSPQPTGSPTAPVDGDSLRELSWSDLRARLAAARDLRASLARSAIRSPVRDMASFDGQSARHVAALASGKDGVNPSDLANGKGNGSMTAASHDVPDDRPLRI